MFFCTCKNVAVLNLVGSKVKVTGHYLHVNCCTTAILAAVMQTAQKCIGSQEEKVLRGKLLVLSPMCNWRFFFSNRHVYFQNSLRKVLTNYYKHNCATLARRVYIFRGKFVKYAGFMRSGLVWLWALKSFSFRLRGEIACYEWCAS